MKLYDFSFPSPAENLAGDEALLDWCEENDADEILRFWESPEYFVVVGYANKIVTEVNVANCEAKQIPVFRRCSGGGTVLQGKGCLNYALILRIEDHSPLANITSTNKFIMERNRAAIESVIRNPQSAIRISVCGHTDLALAARQPSSAAQKKFSGNSQRRRKNFLLFHGTFLLDFDLALISECLQMPSKEPDYRQTRSHQNFLANLNRPAGEVKSAMQNFWNASSPLKNPPREEISTLAREKYSTREWNWKF